MAEFPISPNALCEYCLKLTKYSGSTKNIFNTKCRCIYKTFLIAVNELDFTKRCIRLFSRRKVEYFISITDTVYHDNGSTEKYDYLKNFQR